jgi:hypothetical protein
MDLNKTQKSFITTSECINKELANLDNREDILFYLTQIKDYTNGTLKMAKAYLKKAK